MDKLVGPDMEYYTMLKRYELSRHKKTWNKLTLILLSETGQFENVTY